MTRLLLAAQGAYYVLTGAWPLVSLRTFEAVTGPKTDDWLVRTVGALAAVIGATLLLGLGRNPPGREIVFLAVAGAGTFAAIDVAYVLDGTLRPIYLGDAAAEAILAVALLTSRAVTRRDTP